ncbi:7918_t:CDS:2, partial [Scutellospora calospora]
MRLRLPPTARFSLDSGLWVLPDSPDSRPQPSPSALDSQREISSIPRSLQTGKALNAAERAALPSNAEKDTGHDEASGNWIYPSQEMFFNAMKRKDQEVGRRTGFGGMRWAEAGVFCWRQQGLDAEGELGRREDAGQQDLWDVRVISRSDMQTSSSSRPRQYTPILALQRSCDTWKYSPSPHCNILAKLTSRGLEVVETVGEADLAL